MKVLPMSFKLQKIIKNIMITIAPLSQIVKRVKMKRLATLKGNMHSCKTVVMKTQIVTLQKAMKKMLAMTLMNIMI